MASRAVYATRARGRIASFMQAQSTFMTATDVYRALHARRASIALSTVYRTLEHLRSGGELTSRIDERGEVAYMHCEPANHHHHAICRRCGNVTDVDCGALDDFATTLATSHGFTLDAHEMEFFGLCRACR